MMLKNARTCCGCVARHGRSSPACLLGYRLTRCGKIGNSDYYSARPLEPCPKPMYPKQLAAAKHKMEDGMTKKASELQEGGNHYKDMAIQPAEFCQKNRLNFCESAVVKYVCRHGKKNGVDDIKKAIHFLHLLLEWDYQHHPEKLVSDFDSYQHAAAETAIYPTLGHPIVYPALGLAGEAGEVAEKIKKLCRDHDGTIDDERRNAIKKELGDVLWYISEIARQARLPLSEIARVNIEKLSLRKNQGKLHGSGDNREQELGLSIKNICAQCSSGLRATWTFCPVCGNNLNEPL